jgi:hypothetical protein
MNSESGKAHVGGNLFFGPFTVLKILGGGVFGRMAFNRATLNLPPMNGASFVEK